ncbi:MAG TPA: DUF2203 domain-containing protein [Candidatus Dormibacteraeota bacterium]
MSEEPVRTYDAREANAALPLVRQLTVRIVETMAEMPELEDALRIARYKAARGGPSSGSDGEVGRREAAIEEAQAELLRAIRQLDEMGVQLKDPHEGLVDFLSYRDGELVELCWKLGEPVVGHWHRIGEGFPGRKPL